PMHRPPPPSPLFPYTTLFRSLLHAHRVQCDALGEPRDEAFPDEHGEGFPGRETAAVRELGQRVVDTAPLEPPGHFLGEQGVERQDRKSTRLNSSHVAISYAVF